MPDAATGTACLLQQRVALLYAVPARCSSLLVLNAIDVVGIHSLLAAKPVLCLYAASVYFLPLLLHAVHAVPLLLRASDVLQTIFGRW